MDFFDYENISATMTFPYRKHWQNQRKRLSGTKTYMNVNKIFASCPTLQHNNLASSCLTAYICITKRGHRERES